MLFNLLYNIFYFIVIISIILYFNKIINGDDNDISIKTIRNNKTHTMETFENGKITKRKIDDSDSDNDNDNDDSDNNDNNNNDDAQKLEDAKNEIEKFKAGFSIDAKFEIDPSILPISSYSLKDKSINNSTSTSKSSNENMPKLPFDINKLDMTTIASLHRDDFITTIDIMVQHNKRLELTQAVLKFINSQVDLIKTTLSTIATMKHNQKSFENVAQLITKYDTLKKTYGENNANIIAKNDEIIQLISDINILNKNVDGFMTRINSAFDLANITENTLMNMTDDEFKNKLLELFDIVKNVFTYITNGDKDALLLKENVEKLTQIINDLETQLTSTITNTSTKDTNSIQGTDTGKGVLNNNSPFTESFINSNSTTHILNNMKNELKKLESQLNNQKVETFLNSVNNIKKNNEIRNIDNTQPFDNLIFGSSLSSFSLF